MDFSRCLFTPDLVKKARRHFMVTCAFPENLYNEAGGSRETIEAKAAFVKRTSMGAAPVTSMPSRTAMAAFEVVLLDKVASQDSVVRLGAILAQTGSASIGEIAQILHECKDLQRMREEGETLPILSLKEICTSLQVARARRETGISQES